MTLLCVTGVDGAGKSSLIERLVPALRRATAAEVAASSIWTTCASGTPARVHPEAHRAVDAYLAPLKPAERLRFLLERLRASLDAALSRSPGICVLDGYWYKYAAVEVAFGVGLDAVLRLTEGFPRPDRVYHLRLPLAAAAARKPAPTRYESGFGDPTPESFVTFQREVLRALRAVLRSAFPPRLGGKARRGGPARPPLDPPALVTLDARRPIEALVRAIVADVTRDATVWPARLHAARAPRLPAELQAGAANASPRRR